MKDVLLSVSGFSRKHDCISTLSNRNSNVGYLCTGRCRMNYHAFKHICCNDNCFSHATACVDYLFLMKVIQFNSS
ncbi:hypothetical protein Hanom_Chr02g00153331 [Helianthus anomalus]